MWTRSYHSCFLAIRIREIGRFGFMILIPTFALNEVLDALEDLLWMAERIFPQWSIPINPHRGGQGISPYRIIKLCNQLFYELRKGGKWKMVEVDTDDIRINVDFI